MFLGMCGHAAAIRKAQSRVMMRSESVDPSAALGSDGKDPSWQLLQALPLAVVVIGAQGRLLWLNSGAEHLLCADAEHAVGRHWSELMHLYGAGVEGSDERLTALSPAAAQAAPPADRHFRLIRGDGTQRVVQISPIPRSAAWPRTWRSVLAMQECTAAYERYQRLRRESSHDHLTDLVNRREFERRLGNAVQRSQRDGSRHALLFMDLDRFKQINDGYGHAAGDAVLRQVARTLRTMVRKRDTLARLGGDEFALLLEQCDLHEGMQTARKLRERLHKRHFVWRGTFLSLDVSVGVVGIDRWSRNPDRVLASADAACYRAKRHSDADCA
jgi:diguanylate cyclase (GGDEF)-like protein